MTTKRILCEQRLRRIPTRFSWIDQRLVFDGHLERCDASAAALYLLLVTVADVHGLSYWGDARVARLLRMPAERLVRSRENLIGAGLLAYERPLYQVLSLDAPTPLSMPSPAIASSVETPAATAPSVDRQELLQRLAQLRASLVAPR
jgi:hypothetical protein